MLQKFKITIFAVTLCLFGLTLITVSPVFAEDSSDFIACQQMKWKHDRKAKKNCFMDLARTLEASTGTVMNKPTDTWVGSQDELDAREWCMNRSDRYVAKQYSADSMEQQSIGCKKGWAKALRYRWARGGKGL